MAHQVSLAVALLTTAAWLLWAEHAGGGWRVVLTTAGLWWLAALQATWPVWLPAGVVLAGLGGAIPPRRRQPAPGPRLLHAPTPVRSPAVPVPPADQDPAQERTPEAPQPVTPASTPAPVRTVWEAFTPLPQERDDGAAS